MTGGDIPLDAAHYPPPPATFTGVLQDAGRWPRALRVLLVGVVLPTTMSAAFDGTNGLVPHADDWRPAHVAVPEIPPFVAAVTTAGESSVLTFAQLQARFAAAGANWPVIRRRSSEFLVLDHRWLRRFLDWQRHFRWQFDLEFQSELQDCDDFSLGMMAFVDLAMLRAGVQSRVALVGRLMVRPTENWASVRAGGLHEVVLVATDRGLFVVEPQNGMMIELENYPNRAHFRRLVLN